MSETDRTSTQSDQTAVQSNDGDGIELVEDIAAEEVAFISDDPADAPVLEDREDAKPERIIESTPPMAPVTSPAPTRQASSTGSMIIGGALAAAIGSFATLAFFPEGWRAVDMSSFDTRIAAIEAASGGSREAELAAALAPLDARLTAIESAAPSAEITGRIAALESLSATDIAPLSARVATLEAAGLDAQALSAAIAPINTRIAQIEADIAAQARTAVEAALANARAEVEAQAASLSSREGNVAAAQALAELVAAAESGEPQPEALSVLAEVTTLPEDLALFSDGVVTLAALQTGFAPAAREALSAVAPPPDAPLSDRVLNFLRNQTGARSLAPRDGDTTDAVLSRAEAALRQGEVAAALLELDALSEGPAATMAGWQAQAEARLQAMAALSMLQDQLTGNEG